MAQAERREIWISVYALAMAAVESAVVLYLRALHPGDAPVSCRPVTKRDLLRPVWAIRS